MSEEMLRGVSDEWNGGLFDDMQENIGGIREGILDGAFDGILDSKCSLKLDFLRYYSR